MPSSQHQWLVLWIARKMLADGYVVLGYHGPTPQGGLLNDVAIPPVVRSIRPDVLAFKPGHTAVALGEAKTADDLSSTHTLHQFKMLRSALDVEGWSATIYVAVPCSAARGLDAMLVKAGLIGSKKVLRLHIPDCLVGEESTVLA